MFWNSFHKNPIPNNVYPIDANSVTTFAANFLCSALGHGPWFGWLSKKIIYSAKSIWWQAFVRSVTAEYAQNQHDYAHTHTYIRKLFYIFACLTLFLIIVHKIGESTIDDHIILATHHADDVTFISLFHDELIEYLGQNCYNGDANGIICCYSWNMRWTGLGTDNAINSIRAEQNKHLLQMTISQCAHCFPRSENNRIWFKRRLTLFPYFDNRSLFEAVMVQLTDSYIPFPEPVVIKWQSSGNPVCLELRPQCTLECHSVASVFPVCLQWCFNGLPVCFNYAN